MQNPLSFRQTHNWKVRREGIKSGTGAIQFYFSKWTTSQNDSGTVSYLFWDFGPLIFSYTEIMSACSYRFQLNNLHHDLSSGLLLYICSNVWNFTKMFTGLHMYINERKNAMLNQRTRLNRITLPSTKSHRSKRFRVPKWSSNFFFSLT
jgi:hypothetical protein